MSIRPAYDAVVVGSGPNGLAAAITLARAGRSVIVFEAREKIGAVVGLLALDVAHPRWLARVGATLTILGNLLRIGAALWNFVVRTSVADAPTTPFIVLSVFLLIGGLAILGVTTLLGKRLSGWQAWTPLLVGGFALITAVVFSINLYLHFILLGLWGLPWLLVGYVVFTHAAKEQQAQHHVVSDTTAHPQGQRLG